MEKFTEDDESETEDRVLALSAAYCPGQTLRFEGPERQELQARVSSFNPEDGTHYVTLDEPANEHRDFTLEASFKQGWGFTFDNNLVITAVKQGGQADNAGVKLGSLIVRADGKPVATRAEFRDTIVLEADPKPHVLTCRTSFSDRTIDLTKTWHQVVSVPSDFPDIDPDFEADLALAAKLRKRHRRLALPTGVYYYGPLGITSAILTEAGEWEYDPRALPSSSASAEGSIDRASAAHSAAGAADGMAWCFASGQRVKSCENGRTGTITRMEGQLYIWKVDNHTDEYSWPIMMEEASEESRHLKVSEPFRYQAEQKLTIYHDGHWCDAVVEQYLGPDLGNKHNIVFYDKKGNLSYTPVEVDLNAVNHCVRSLDATTYNQAATDYVDQIRTHSSTSTDLSTWNQVPALETETYFAGSERTGIANMRELIGIVGHVDEKRQEGIFLSSRYLMHGDLGLGKTWACEHISARLVSRNHPEYMPLYISCKDIVNDLVKHLENWNFFLISYIHSCYGETTATMLLEAMASSRLVVIFDGLDEVGEVVEEMLLRFIKDVIVPTPVRVILSAVSTYCIDHLRSHLETVVFQPIALQTTTQEQEHAVVKHQLQGFECFDKLVSMSRIRLEQDEAFGKHFTEEEKLTLECMEYRDLSIFTNGFRDLGPDPDFRWKHIEGGRFVTSLNDINRTEWFNVGHIVDTNFGPAELLEKQTVKGKLHYRLQFHDGPRLAHLTPAEQSSRKSDDEGLGLRRTSDSGQVVGGANGKPMRFVLPEDQTKKYVRKPQSQYLRPLFDLLQANDGKLLEKMKATLEQGIEEKMDLSNLICKALDISEIVDNRSPAEVEAIELAHLAQRVNRPVDVLWYEIWNHCDEIYQVCDKLKPVLVGELGELCSNSGLNPMDFVMKEDVGPLQLHMRTVGSEERKFTDDVLPHASMINIISGAIMAPEARFLVRVLQNLCAGVKTTRDGKPLELKMINMKNTFKDRVASNFRTVFFTLMMKLGPATIFATLEVNHQSILKQFQESRGQSVVNLLRGLVAKVGPEPDVNDDADHTHVRRRQSVTVKESVVSLKNKHLEDEQKRKLDVEVVRVTPELEKWLKDQLAFFETWIDNGAPILNLMYTSVLQGSPEPYFPRNRPELYKFAVTSIIRRQCRGSNERAIVRMLRAIAHTLHVRHQKHRFDDQFIRTVLAAEGIPSKVWDLYSSSGVPLLLQAEVRPDGGQFGFAHPTIQAALAATVMAAKLDVDPGFNKSSAQGWYAALTNKHLFDSIVLMAEELGCLRIVLPAANVTEGSLRTLLEVLEAKWVSWIPIHFVLRQNEIGRAGMDAVVEFFQQDFTLSHLDMAGCSKEVLPTEDIVAMLTHQEQLEMLDLRRTAKSREEASKVAAAVLQHQGIRVFNSVPVQKCRQDALSELDLSGQCIGADGAFALAGLTHSMVPSLIRANLLRNSLAIQDVRAIISALEGKQGPRLQTISGFQPGQTEADLAGNSLDPADAVLIAWDLQFGVVSSSLLNLRLASNTLTALGLETAGIEALMHGLNNNVTLVSLDISKNSIQDHMAQQLASVILQRANMEYFNGIPVAKLRKNSVRDLDFTPRPIGLEGAYLVKDLLSVARSIETMKINSFIIPIRTLKTYDITKDGAHPLNVKSDDLIMEDVIVIGACLAANLSLTSVNLMGNKLSPAGWACFKQALDTHGKLKSLCGIPERAKAVNLSNLDIDHDDASVLSQELERNDHIVTLCMDGNPLGQDGLRELSKGLARNLSIHSLQMAYSEIHRASSSALSEALEMNSHIQDLILDHNRIGETDAKEFAGCLTVNTTLLSLRLQNNKIDDDGLTIISKALSQNSAITSLDLGHNLIGDVGAESLARMLRNTTSLQSLNLDSNDVGEGIGDSGCRAIAESLQKNESLTSLSLASTCIFDDGAIALFKALRFNQAVSKLHLQNNRVTSHAATTIAETLKVNKVLRILNLGSNPLGDDGTADVFQALARNSTLKSLDASDTRMDSLGATALAESLRRNDTLEILAVRDNWIRDRGIEILAASLQSNSTLHTLRIDNNRIGNGGAPVLLMALGSNTGLRTLGLEQHPWIRDSDKDRIKEAATGRVAVLF